MYLQTNIQSIHQISQRDSKKVIWKARELNSEKRQTMMPLSPGAHVSKVVYVYWLKRFSCPLSWSYELTFIVIKMGQTVPSVYYRA